MKIKDKTIKIDIEKSTPKTLKYENYKDDESIKFLILENNREVDLSDYTAEIFFNSSKDDFFSIQCRVTKNVVEVPLTKVFHNKKGDFTFEIVFVGNGQRVTTFAMYLKI